MPQHNHIDLIEFPAKSGEEVQQTKQFFSQAFGWKFQEYGPDYADTHDSGTTAGINGSTTKEQNAPLAVIYSEDLEATKETIVKAGGEITHDITPFPGGRRFAFREPSGNQLAVWSDK
jgi:predicted enzyme related to lactoylglutathione lyase